MQELEEKLQCDIDGVVSWCKINQLTLNIGKTKQMEFRATPKALQNRGGVNIRIAEKALEQVSEYKYLGTLFDEKLSGI